MENNDFEEQYLLLEEENKKEERRKNIFIIVLCIIIILLSLIGATYSFFVYRSNQQVDLKNKCKLNCDLDGDKKCDLNCDIDSDGKADLNIDVDGDGIADINITGTDGKPYINIDFSKDGYAHFNIDTDNDNIPDFNLMNQDLNGDGICDLNCDTDDDGWPNINIDFDGDGKADANIYVNGECSLNCQIINEQSDETDSSNSILSISTKSSVKVYMTALKNVKADGIAPGWSDIVEFKITNESNENVYFKLDWVNVKNTLSETNNVVYTLTKNNVEIKSAEQFPYADTTILNKVLLTPNSTYTYKAKFEFRETGLDQSVDMSKEFSGSIKASIVE